MKWVVLLLCVTVLAIAGPSSAEEEFEQLDTDQLLREHRGKFITFLDHYQSCLTSDERLEKFQPEGLPSLHPMTVEEGMKLLATLPTGIMTALERVAKLHQAWRSLKNAVKAERSDIEDAFIEVKKLAQQTFVQVFKQRTHIVMIKNTIARVERERKLPQNRDLERALDLLALSLWREARWFSTVFSKLAAEGGLTSENAGEAILACSGCDKIYNRGHLIRRINPNKHYPAMTELETLRGWDLTTPTVEWDGMLQLPEGEDWATWANRVDFPRSHSCDQKCVWQPPHSHSEL